MNDELPRLPRDDPENLLSTDARKRIQRAHIEAEKFVWETEALIESRRPQSDKAQELRNLANLRKARAVLAVMREEYSGLRLPDAKFSKCMRAEIDAAVDSLQLSQAQQRLLEVEFYFQSETAALPVALSKERAPAARPAPIQPTIGEQITKLRAECRLTVDELAEKVGVQPRTVRRHQAGRCVPRYGHLRAYEGVFSKILKDKVVIVANVRKTSAK
jgi:DNA-binding XRE family transcriptional regulator